MEKKDWKISTNFMVKEKATQSGSPVAEVNAHRGKVISEAGKTLQLFIIVKNYDKRLKCSKAGNIIYFMYDWNEIVSEWIENGSEDALKKILYNLKKLALKANVPQTPLIDVEDVVQIAFIRFCPHIKKLYDQDATGGEFQEYAKKVVRSVINDFWREIKGSSVPLHAGGEEDEQFENKIPDERWGDPADRIDVRSAVVEVISALDNPTHKKIAQELFVKLLDETAGRILRNTEIAKKYHVSPALVTYIYKKVKEELRKKFKSYQMELVR